MNIVKNICIVCIVFLAGLGWWRYLDLRIRVALAEEQTRFFEEVVNKIVKNKPSQGEIESALEAIKIYYPSGSKQSQGSHLDMMVERARNQARERIETGKDVSGHSKPATSGQN